MDKKKVSAGVAALIASGSLAVDASVYDGKNIAPITETIANERVEVKQVENIVEAKAPWKGEEGITVKYDMKEPSLAEKVRDRRKEEVIYEKVDFGDGGFKIDVLLTEKPSTNKFCYTIEGAENYDFFYQPPLTPEEIAEGAYRPPEIEGSYAVYHKTLKNHVIGQQNYATGKVMHIPRPQVWELGNEENKVWADLSYDEKEGLCVTAPQEFIDNADYTNGVRIDPTFGYTSIGASATSLVANTIRAQEYSAPESGILQKLTTYTDMSSGAGAPARRGVVYNVDTSDTLVTFGAENVVPDGPAWRDMDVTDTSITSGTTYLLGMWLNDPGGGAAWNVYHDTTGQLTYRDAETYSPVTDPPTTFSRDMSLDIKISIYATYEPYPYGTLRINNGTIRINNGTLDI